MVPTFMSRISFINRIFILGGSSGGCSCSVPILNGYTRSLAVCHYEGKLYYYCADGFERAFGTYPSTCWLGQWRPTPSCKPKACFDAKPNGYILGTCTFGSSCDYYCDYGYYAAQTNVMCDASSHWTVNAQFAVLQ